MSIPSESIMTKRVAVIGAGPSGTSVLSAFASAEQQGEITIPRVIVCFEKQAEVGGQWIFSPSSSGHSGMYRDLWSNGPKECLEFANYTFEEHFHKKIPSYPPRPVLLNYIQGRARRYGVSKWIRFNTQVDEVFYGETNHHFEIKSKNVSSPSSAHLVEHFDYVFVCTGHFHTPDLPTFEGLNAKTFNGEILHAHDIRDFSEFPSKRLLVIGSSYSAEDVAVQSYKFGCRNITLSYRTAPMHFDWPQDGSFQTKPLLQKIVSGNQAVFVDGSTAEIDTVVLCTGYKHSFPFLAPNLRLETNNRLWIDDCYQGIVWEKAGNRKLFYIGMQDQWLTFNMFDAQAWYARDIILGKIGIPGKNEREEHFRKWREREKSLETDEDNIRFQVEYTAALVEATDYPSWDFELTVQTFLEWEEAKHASNGGIFKYRDQAHMSAFTGSMAPSPTIPWMDNTDDSLEAFLVDAKNVVLVQGIPVRGIL